MLSMQDTGGHKQRSAVEAVLERKATQSRGFFDESIGDLPKADVRQYSKPSNSPVSAVQTINNIEKARKSRLEVVDMNNFTSNQSTARPNMRRTSLND